jgi:hypothetical protein
MRAVARVVFFLVSFPIIHIPSFGLNKIVASINKTAKINRTYWSFLIFIIGFYPSPLKAEAFDWNT